METECKERGMLAVWIDTRINKDNMTSESGVIIGSGVQKNGVEYYEIRQDGKYRAIEKRLVKSITSRTITAKSLTSNNEENG